MVEQDLWSLALEYIKMFFAFPVWPFVIFVNLSSLVFHFSVLAQIQFVKTYRKYVVFGYSTIIGILLGLRDITSHDFAFSDDDLIYQARLISSWAVAVGIYHVGGIKWGVGELKKKMKAKNGN
jgi:hypothetical protein